MLARAGADVVLGVHDDGRGFDAGSPSAGYGLDGMRRRLAAAGGLLEVASGPDGTRLTARIPAHAAALPAVASAVAPAPAATPASTPARA